MALVPSLADFGVAQGVRGVITKTAINLARKKPDREKQKQYC
jgi:hypothetical protein